MHQDQQLQFLQRNIEASRLVQQLMRLAADWCGASQGGVCLKFTAPVLEIILRTAGLAKKQRKAFRFGDEFHRQLQQADKDALGDPVTMHFPSCTRHGTGWAVGTFLFGQRPAELGISLVPVGGEKAGSRLNVDLEFLAEQGVLSKDGKTLKRGKLRKLLRSR